VSGPDEPEDDDPEEVFVERELAEAEVEGAVQLKPDHAPRRDHQRRLVDVVADWLAEGKSYVEVTDLAVAATGCHPRTATRAIAEVRKRWKDAGQTTVEDRRDRFRARLELVWNRALEDGDYRAIAVMARTLADIEGIKAAKEVRLSGEVGLKPVAAMSPEERRREIAALQAKQLAAGGKPTDEERNEEPVKVPKARDRGGN
jgi:hypothetical protein